MTEFTVTVKNSKKNFILNLLKEFKYVQVKENKNTNLSENEKILNSVSEAVEELNAYRKGKVKIQDAFVMFDELKKEIAKENGKN